MVRGDTPTNTFQGEAIDWQYIRLRNICRVSASDGADTIRTIIFQWFDSSTPTVGNILNTGNGVEPILAPYQWGNRKMRRILSDKCYTTVSTASNDERTDNIFIPGSRLQKTWFSSLNANTVKGNLYVLQVSNSVVAPNPSQEIAFEGVYIDDL